jgi:hypothetical protein
MVNKTIIESLVIEIEKLNLWFLKPRPDTLNEISCDHLNTKLYLLMIPRNNIYVRILGYLSYL